ncbi:MAG: hypothetical protein MJK14_22765 [Rivularia sp. ALOHA_DT_140]|nr:hypothetical protein [Rivularia sp. ALOHA_DT_140]
MNWFFIQQTTEIREWWKLRGSQDLQELKDCDNLQDIRELLPLFFARDLQQDLQITGGKAVVIIDNYESLVDAEGECNWLKKIIQINPSILWVIFAEKPVNLTNKSQNIAIPNLTDAESQVILQKSGIENSEISQLIIQASEGIPLYLYLGLETYLTIAKHKSPQKNDFANDIEEIIPKLYAAWNWYERRIWQILSNCCSWDEVLFAKLMSDCLIVNCDWICDCWGKLFHKVVKSRFVESNAQGFRLNPIIREYLYKNQPDNLQQSVNTWLFEYYKAQYQQSQLQLSVFVKLLEHGLKSQQQQ